MTALDRSIVALALLACFAAPSPARAQRTCAPRPVAIFQSIRNDVQLLQTVTRVLIQPSRQLPICAGDTVHVGDDSRAVVLMLESNTPLVIDQNSDFVITEASAGRPSLVDLVRGALLFITRVPRSIEIRTPFVNAAIEGTEFVVRVETDRTVITVFEGAVRASNPQGTLLVGAGQQAVAVQGQAPQLQITVRPRDAVQWALYYEPVLPADSFAQLAAVPDAARDANFYVRRAALLLGVGQVDEAGIDLEQAQRLDPANGNTYTIRTITAVAANDTAAALTNGRMAVERAQGSAAAHIALSYAYQAASRLEDARDEVNTAVMVQADNGVAWARLSELRLMLDDINGAVSAARRAAALSPQLARAQVALGFALLAQLHLDDARDAFDRAIELEADHPFAHLGLGLTEIRQGQLEQGRGELEMAVALDSENSLLRSYLGKAYFEEKRTQLTEEALDSAKRLDPLDPTPWFYRAIQLEASNRPVEAMAELQRSIQLNGNRAVYRSRLLLDQDLAVRGARLGAIYRDLGFQHLALAEGWKSLAVDPTNYSAHRLLADNYLVLPRHGIARDSELLQAQLLQPLNINPVQPLTADNGLVVLDDTGPYGSGFNEYTRLFSGNQVRLTADGTAGQNGTRADDLIVSGIFNRLSYSVGQSHYDTDGIRLNNRLRQDIYNGFVQGTITPGTSVQLELRKNRSFQGDRRLLFDPTNFLAGQRSPGDVSSARIGGRKNITAADTVIGQYAHRDLTTSLDTGVGLRTSTKEDADLVEIRYLRGWRRANVTAGYGHYGGLLTDNLQFGPIAFPPSTVRTHHTNGYAYGTAGVTDRLALTAGLATDRFDSGTARQRLTSPKLGGIWNAAPAVTIRAAAFRTFRRTLLLSQTIEPTEVAGFNQFFDEPPSTRAWNYGLGVDTKVGTRLNVGAEGTLRRLKVPVTLVATRTEVIAEQEDQFATTYLNMTPTRWLSLTTDYTFEHLIREPTVRNGDLVVRSRIHRVSTDARAFHSSGWFVRFKESFVDQRGRFLNVRNAVFDGRDNFWVADGSAGFRFPRQLGTISVDVRNLFDTSFRYQDSAPREPVILPVRLAITRLTLSF